MVVEKEGFGVFKNTNIDVIVLLIIVKNITLHVK